MGKIVDKVTNGWASPNQMPDSNNNDVNPSRLTTSTSGLRETLLSRNLYTEFTEYPLQPDKKQRVINSIGSIIDKILPFKSVNITDTAISRLVTTPNTPLVDIGLIMLGKQFGLNFQSNLIQETVPTFNLRNMFDGNSDTKLFQPKIKYNISRKTKGGSLEQFTENFFGYHPRRNAAGPSWGTNLTEMTDYYLKNTGDGQLDFLFGSKTGEDGGGINKNIYKPTSTINWFDAAQNIKNGIGNRINIVSDKIWFNFNNYKFNPYDTINPSSDSIKNANTNMINAYKVVSNVNGYNVQEYAPNNDFIENNFGKTDLDRNAVYLPNSKYSDDPYLNNQWVDTETGLNDNIQQQIVWGRDGAEDIVHKRLNSLRGVSITNSDGEEFGLSDVTPRDLKTRFNIKTGLLEYTRNLLNASEGKLVDQTRKIYTDGENLVGMNGSALWKAPENSLFSGAAGLRQHSILDQYDRFAKAIRFDGNKVYGGNPNSVVFKSVIPRVHPTIGEGNGGVDNKNLTFSIENLAVKVIKGDKGISIIDDEFGTQIPTSEVGHFGGRLMWFPPYGLEITEVAQAKYDSTVMIGRSEPIYSYQHSERSATLSFKLLIDYPEQLRNYIKTGNHKAVSEFFAFGGQSTNNNSVGNTEKKEDDNKKKEEEVKGPDIVKLNLPDEPESVLCVFPNDIPKVGTGGYGIIDDLFNKTWYEVSNDVYNKAENVTGSLNKNLFLITGLTENGEIIVPDGFTQSGVRYINGKRLLDDNIFEQFNNPEFTKYIKIRITGSATTLYTPNDTTDIEKQKKYNLDLSQRRIDSTLEFVKERIKRVLNNTAENLNIIFETVAIGDENSEEKNGTVAAIKSSSAKVERSTTIDFVRMGTEPDPKDKLLSTGDIELLRTLNEENQALQKATNTYRRNGIEDIMEERGAGEVLNDGSTINDGGILKGFQSIKNNNYYPMFHSQTPEDFHKRLTFLQQCTRQGSAIRSNPEVDKNGVTRVKNSVFGRQPICVLRIADFFYTKVIIESVTVDYSDAPWDTNPEGMGMQPMMADVQLQLKVIGGQSLKGPIDALQNAVSFNYYANSTFRNDFGPYEAASNVESLQHGNKEDAKNLADKINKRTETRKPFINKVFGEE